MSPRLLWIPVVLLSAGALIGGWLAFLPNTETRNEDGAVSVKIPPGSSFDAAVDSLAPALRSETSFRAFGTLTGWRRQVKPGHYRIASGMSNWATLDKIRKGLQDPVRVTVPPGTRPAVFAAVLHRDLGVDSAAVMEALFSPSFADSVGTDTTHLFGHMRPNTFDILWTTSARTAIRRLHDWYERYWTDERRAKAKALGLTPDEVVTLASIVEWEAKQPAERPRIAGVYLNRLFGRTASGTMRLQADPTVQYALMQIEGGLPRRLFIRDYDTDHPYNTYRIDGLPPGPITNPSESSIEAVLDAEDHDYLYFVANGTGGHTFSETLAQHNAAADAWSRWLSEQVRIREAREDSARTGAR